MKSKMIALAVAATSLTINSAHAGFFNFTPKVPEIDNGGGVAAVAIIVSLVAILAGKVRGGR